jgi:hypothetical protein
MEINVLAIALGAVGAIVFGAIWYGPIFGRKWLEVNEVTSADLARRAEMQKETKLLYGVQIVFCLVQMFVFTLVVENTPGMMAFTTAFWIWIGFVVPTVAGLAMWNAKPAKVRLTLFLLSSGYQGIIFLWYAFILSWLA